MPNRTADKIKLKILADEDEDSAEAEAVFAQGLKDIAKAAENYKATFKDVCPPLSKEEAEDLVPVPVFDQYWTQQDEDALADEIGVDAVNTNSHETALWKFCLRTLRCWPLDIVSPAFHLEYRSTNAQHERLDGPYPAWSHRFCIAMEALLLHHFWQGKIKCLVVAIQYAVICRTGDTRRWPMPAIPWDHFLVEFRRIVETSPSRFPSPQAMHKIAIAAYVARHPGWPLPQWSRLFSYIEAKTPKLAGTPGVTEGDQFEPYGVVAGDLETVAGALDAMDSNVPTKIISDIATSEMWTRDPPHEKDMPRVKRAVLLAWRREAARKERQGQAHSAEEQD